MVDKKKFQQLSFSVKMFMLLLGICLAISMCTMVANAQEADSNKLQNGSFEKDQSWKKEYMQLEQDAVPYWNTTAFQGKIELFMENKNTYFKNPDMILKPSDELYAAELNADEESTLYQNVITTPSSVYEWGLDHGARNGADTMALIIGPSQSYDPSKPSKAGRDQLMQMVDWLIEQGETSIKTTAGLGEQITVYSKKFGANGTFEDNAGNNAFSLVPSTIYTEEWHVWIISSVKGTGDTNPWYSYGANAEDLSEPEADNGQAITDKYYTYKVPDKQNKTLFAFVSVGYVDSPTTGDKAKTYGNFLDGINFQTYHPLSASTTTHGSVIIGTSSGTGDNEFEIGPGESHVTYVKEGDPIKIQAIITADDAVAGCEFVGAYYNHTKTDGSGDVNNVFLGVADNVIDDSDDLTDEDKKGKWIKSVNDDGDIIYTYYLEELHSPTNLNFIFIKNPTVTYDSNGGKPYKVDRIYNTQEAENVYSFKPATDKDEAMAETATVFIDPYVSHAAEGQNDGWKFMGWLLTGDSISDASDDTELINADKLGSMILPAEHTIACDYKIHKSSGTSTEQYFKIYDGNVSMTKNVIIEGSEVKGVKWSDNGEEKIYANVHKGLTMVAQWRWLQSFIPQTSNGNGYDNSNAGGTVEITSVSDESDENYNPNYKGCGKSYFAETDERITVEAVAKDGYIFRGWYDESGKLITTNATYSYTETAKSVNTIYARFSPYVIQNYIRQVKNGDTWEVTSDDSIGTLDRYSYTDLAGVPISSTATAGAGYYFVGWYDSNGNAVDKSMLTNNGATISYTTTGDATYYARFIIERPDSLKVSAKSYIGQYDGAAHGITVVGATDANDKVYYSTDNINWSETAPTRTNVQNKETIYVKVENPNYGTAFTSASITITPREVTITVNNAEKFFGEDDPTFSGGITSGSLVADNDLGKIDYVRTEEAKNINSVGTHKDALTAKYTENANYKVTVINGDFTIKPITVDGAKVTATGGSKVYDGQPLYATAQLQNADGYTIYYSTDDGTSWSTDAPSVTNVSEGTVTVSVKATKEGHADLTCDDVQISVTPREVTITVDNAEKFFGEDDPTFTGGITSGTLVADSDLGDISYGRTEEAKDTNSVGTHKDALTAKYTENANYKVKVIKGTLKINPKTVDGAKVTATGGSKVYDGKPLYASVQLENADGYTIYYSTDGTNWKTDAPSVTDVSEGTVTVFVKATKEGHADLTCDKVQISIIPREVTITVDNAEKFFGDPDPTFSGGITSGSLVNENDLGEITYGRTDTAMSYNSVGTYEKALTAKYTENANYIVVVDNGDLVIKPVKVEGAAVTATGGSKEYDGKPLYASAQLENADGYTIYYSTNGESWQTEAPSVTNVSEGTVKVSVKATKEGHADLTCDPVQISIIPREVTITVDDKQKLYGANDPDFTGRITSGTLVAENDLGTISYGRTEEAKDIESVGTHTDALTASYTENSNYKVTVNNGDLIITTAPVSVITVTKTANQNRVQVGSNITWTVTVNNSGDATATGLNLVDSLDGVTINAPQGIDYKNFDLAAHESIEFTVIYKAENAGTYVNHVDVNKPKNNPDGEPTVEKVAEADSDAVVVSKPSGSKPTLNTKDHVAYIIGYEDGTVKPNNNITRAEVATIFFRLLSEDSRTEFWSQTNGYSDIAPANWFNNAVSTLANAGIISGYPDGTFRPNAPITRAEFAAIAARFSDVVYGGSSSFSDVSETNWAYNFISLAEHLGWISGYPDGTFKPNQNISRAEAMTLINRVLERAVEADNMSSDMVEWVDCQPDAWYYEAVQEATNSHKYTRLNKQVDGLDFCYEKWQKIIDVPDWAALEKNWSTANK